MARASGRNIKVQKVKRENYAVRIGQCTMVETQDIAAISQLVLSERESRDMGWWTRMRECFHQDARIRLSWIDGNVAEFVEGSIDMAARGMKAKHRVGPPVIRINGDRGVASLSAIIDIPATVKGQDVTLSSYARFLYRVERREEVWRIAFFDAIYLRDELVAAIPGQVIHVTADEVLPFRKSYRMLCYLLSLSGYTPDQNLAGEDSPTRAFALTTEVYGWAEMKADSS